MAGSIASLDPLSSPSTSPSPPPPSRPASPGTHKAQGAGLDGDSELSELTEDEQDNEKNDTSGQSSGENRRKTPKRLGRKQKRGSLVPAPMWDWAYKKRNNDGIAEEEEEEEEDRRPSSSAKMMEEEEDEDDGGPVAPAHHSNAASRRVPASQTPGEGANSSGQHSDYSDSVRKSRSRGRGDDGESEAGMEDPMSFDPSRSGTKDNSPDLTDEEENDDDEGRDDPEKDDEGDPEDDDEEDDPRPPTRPEEEDDIASSGGDSEDEEPRSNVAALRAGAESLDAPNVSLAIPVPSKGPVDLMDVDVDLEPDSTAPEAPGAPTVPKQMAEKAAASSIMAGSTVIEEEEDVPSSEEEEEGSDDELRGGNRAPDSATRASKEREKPTSAVGGSPTRSAAVPSANAEEQEDEADLEEDADDLEVDEPELELQPAHRAEALDVLSQIEFKFAVLREKLYMERMEGLAWEEALVVEETHPELIHLQAELTKRRDTRLELADRRRIYEVDMVKRKRKNEEDALWSWWMHSRDRLQADMVAETNRKRRRLERERRALERAPPTRRIPDPPTSVGLAPSLRELVKSSPFGVSTARTARKAIDAANKPPVYPQLSTLSSGEVNADLDYLYQHRRPYGHQDQRSIFAPQDPHRNLGPPMPPGIGPPGPVVYDPNAYYADFGGSGPSRMNPNAFHQQQQVMPGYTGPSLPQKTPLGMMASGPGGHHQQLQMGLQDHDIGMVSAQGAYGPPQVTGMRRSLSPVQVMSNGFGPGSHLHSPWMGPVPTGPRMKRPSTPDWRDGRKGAGPGLKDEVSQQERVRESERERDRVAGVLGVWERNERDRELARERDQRERFGMSFMQQAQVQQPQHRHHVHAPPGPVPHQPPLHHHHHHHHVHHHHHPLQSGSGASAHGSSLSGPVGPLPVGPGLSPRVTATSRDLDARPHSGPPTTEVINLSSSSSKPNTNSPIMNAYFRGEDSDFTRDRDRPRQFPGLASAGDGERFLTPFSMTPAQAMIMSQVAHQGSPSGSSSVAQSPRGPWNAGEDISLRRPASASMSLTGAGQGQGSPVPAHPLSGPMLRHQPPSSRPGSMGSSIGGSMGLSSPRGSRPPPPASPSSILSAGFPGPLRSPTRSAPSGPSPPTVGSSSAPPPGVHSMSSGLPGSTVSPSMRPMRSSSPGLPSKLMGPPHGARSPPLLGPGRAASPSSRIPPLDSHANGPAGSYNGVARPPSPSLSVFAPGPSAHAGPVPPSSSARPLPPNNPSDKPSPSLPPAPPPKMNVVQLVDGP